MTRRFVQQLIARGADTRCAVDLLKYFQRHPSIFVTSEQLALSVGYAPSAIDGGISALTRAGLLVWRRHPRSMAVLYRLVAEDWLSELAEAASSVRGRRQLRAVLRSRELCQRAAATNRRAEANLSRSDRSLRAVYETARHS